MKNNTKIITLTLTIISILFLFLASTLDPHYTSKTMNMIAQEKGETDVSDFGGIRVLNPDSI